MSAAQHGTAPRQSCLTDDNDIIIIIVAARLRRVVVLLLLLLLLFSVASAHCAVGEGRKVGTEDGQTGSWCCQAMVLQISELKLKFEGDLDGVM